MTAPADGEYVEIDAPRWHELDEQAWPQADLTPYLEQLHDLTRQAVLDTMSEQEIPQEFWPPLVDRTPLEWSDQ